MAGQRRPIGTFKTATVAWKLAVIADMKKLEISRAEMSRRLKRLTGTGTAQALKDLLGRADEVPTEDSSTKLMPAIHQILGWDPPVDEKAPDGDNEDLVEIIRRKSPGITDIEIQMIQVVLSSVAKRST